LTGAKLFLKRSAQEAGLDDRNLNQLQDITRPLLFPTYRWHTEKATYEDSEIVDPPTLVHPKRTASQVYLMNKQRECRERFHKSAHYVQPLPTVDVVRYGQKNRHVAVDVAVLESMGQQHHPYKLATDSRYMPPELFRDSRHMAGKHPPTYTDTNTRVEISGDDLPVDTNDDTDNVVQDAAASGTTPANATAANAGVKEDDEEDEDLVLEEPEEEEIEDYTMNYYESDNESEGDGGGGEDGGEATF
jgi:hypothetical protein